MKRIISICLIFAIALSIGSFTYANDEVKNDNELKKLKSVKVQLLLKVMEHPNLLMSLQSILTAQ